MVFIELIQHILLGAALKSAAGGEKAVEQIGRLNAKDYRAANSLGVLAMRQNNLDEALAKFRGLVANFRDAATPFRSRTRPFVAGDFSGAYDHLARAQEWSIGGDEGGDGGEGSPA